MCALASLRIYISHHIYIGRSAVSAYMYDPGGLAVLDTERLPPPVIKGCGRSQQRAHTHAARARGGRRVPAPAARAAPRRHVRRKV